MGKVVAIHFVPAGDALLRDGPHDDAPGMGRSDGMRQTIAVEDGLPLATEQDTVLHEVLHIVEEYMGMDLDEEIVEKFATGFLAVMKDNPSLVTYLRVKET